MITQLEDAIRASAWPTRTWMLAGSGTPKQSGNMKYAFFFNGVLLGFPPFLIFQDLLGYIFSSHITIHSFVERKQTVKFARRLLRCPSRVIGPKRLESGRGGKIKFDLFDRRIDYFFFNRFKPPMRYIIHYNSIYFYLISQLLSLYNISNVYLFAITFPFICSLFPSDFILLVSSYTICLFGMVQWNAGSPPCHAVGHLRQVDGQTGPSPRRVLVFKFPVTSPVGSVESQKSRRAEICKPWVSKPRPKSFQ